MTTLGFDPGNSGAWAVVHADGRLLDYGRVPLRRHGKRKVVDAVKLGRAIWPWLPNIELAAIEEVHAMPGQGVSSMFTFGRSLGVIEGLLGAYELRPVYLRPKAWQAHFVEGKPDDRKATLVEAAISRWPSLAKPLAVKAAWGIADAALIAEAVRLDLQKLTP